MLTESFVHFFENVGAGWVLWLLLGLAVMSLVVTIERWLYFRRHHADASALSHAMIEALRQGGPKAAREVLGKSPGGMIGGVLEAALDAWDDGVESVEEVVNAAIVRERIQYDRFLPILGTLGSSAPFIGLFGTVIGILVAFGSLGSGLQGAELKTAVMHDISEALVATAVGLFVAIPSIIAFNVYKTKIKVMAAHTEATTRLVLAHLKATDEASRGDDGGTNGRRG